VDASPILESISKAITAAVGVRQRQFLRVRSKPERKPVECDLTGEADMMPRKISSAAGCLAASIVAGIGLTGNALADSFKDKGGRVVFVPTSFEDAKQADGSIVRKVSSTSVSAICRSHSTT